MPKAQLSKVPAVSYCDFQLDILTKLAVRSGLANAKAKGKTLGRRPITKADLPAPFLKYYPSYADGTMSITELARICGLSRPTIYKYIKMVG